MASPPTEMSFEVKARCGRLRHGLLKLPHGPVSTPVFMPVGTQGTTKGILPEQMKALGCEILLNNTYHLGHRPGHQLLGRLGGVHRFQNWDRNLLTDSGGFQMVSLSKLMEVSEEGVTFESPHTAESMLLTPEHCVHIQEAIGADIIMQLDHVIPSLSTGPIVQEAMERSIRWLDRCVAAKTRSDQCLFPIIQGGLDLKLRERCTQEMLKRVTVGIAIGGLSGGESKEHFWKCVARCCELIPDSVPRYVMGVGWPVDMVVAAVLGADMFDCVYPTRTARFGTAITRRFGELNLNQRRFQKDHRPIDPECGCYTCLHYKRSFLHEAIGQETVACHLISIHNLHHHFELMRRLRKAADDQTLQYFLQEFVSEQYGSAGQAPQWVLQALQHAGFKLL